jgi:sporulation protein YlmC with PRC-barrel domain
MSKLAYAAAILAVVSVPAIADTNVQMLRQVPAEPLTVTDCKDVYDSNNNKIGEVMDVLLDKSGKVTSLIIGVGGFWAPERRMLRFRSRLFESPTRTIRTLRWL